MKEWSLISCQVFSDLNPVEDEWGELKRRCESEDLEWFWMKEWSLISCQVISDLNPVETEWGELKRRSCESEGSGVILDEGMVSDLVSGVLWPEPCRNRVRWTEEKKHRHRAGNLKDLEWFWMKQWSLISCQVFSDLNPVEHEWGELKRRSCESKGSGVILDEGMVSDLLSGDLWPEPCRNRVRWTEEKKLWIWRSGVILDEGMVSDLLSGDLWPEPCRNRVRWTEEKKHRHRAGNLKGLEWFWMKQWSLISCQVFSDLNPVEHEWGELKRRSCESKGSGVILDEGMVSDLLSGDLWPEPCRNRVRWTEEKKLWIWRSGVILDEGMLSDLLSGVLWPEPCRNRVRWTEEKKLWI